MITDEYRVDGKVALVVGSAIGQGKAITLATWSAFSMVNGTTRLIFNLLPFHCV